MFFPLCVAGIEVHLERQNTTNQRQQERHLEVTNHH